MTDSVSVTAVQAREHPRYEVSIPVDCSTRHVFVSNHVCNISRGGLFIRSDSPLPLNADVSLVLHLPGTDQCIRATGRVIWNFDMQKGTTHIVPGTGIRFVGMPPSDRAILESYLARLTQTTSAPPLH
jgi:type IV pilus assembly protein PilZ